MKSWTVIIFHLKVLFRGFKTYSARGYIIYKLSRKLVFDILLASDFCRHLITFASSLDPDQDRHNAHNVCPDLGSNRVVFLKPNSMIIYI